MTTINKTELVEFIRTWDKENVIELKDAIEAVFRMDENADQIIDMSDLPTEPIPDGLETYPIWAMDKKGYCLVGDAADSIEHISDIQED